MGITDGASLMRASFDVVRRHRSLLWFPVISTACLVLTAGFWIFEGAWLYAVRGPVLLFVALALFGLYSLTFIGIFFSVALAGATGEAIDGGAPSFGDGVAIAWSRLGEIAVWPVTRSSSHFFCSSSRASRGSACSGRQPRSHGASRLSSSCR